MTPADTRVLVVDGNRDATELLVSLLEALRAKTSVEYDGRSALRLAAELAPRIITLAALMVRLLDC